MSFFGDIFGWDVAFTSNVPLQMVDMLSSIRTLVLIFRIHGGKHPSIPYRDGRQWEPHGTASLCRPTKLSVFT